MSSFAHEPQAIHYVATYDLAMKARQEADNKLFANMELLADWLIDFKQQYGHFPEPGVENDLTLERLKTILKQNPYSQTGITSKEETRPCPVHFINDAGLDARLYEQLKKAPPESWKDDPGSITVICNHENCILIWGAGADKRPLMDMSSGKYRLLFCDSQNRP